MRAYSNYFGDTMFHRSTSSICAADMGLTDMFQIHYIFMSHIFIEKKTDKMKEWRWRCLRDIGIRRKKVKKERKKKCFIGIRCTQWKDKTKWNSRILRATKRDEKILCYIWMRCANAHSSLHKTCACCLWEKLLQYWLIYLSVSRHTRIRHQCDSVDCDVAFLHIFGIQGGRFCRRPTQCFFFLLPFLFRSTCHSKWICNAASAAARL